MAGFRDFWVRMALAAAMAAPLYFLIAAFGTKFGVLDWRLGFGVMTLQYGALVLVGVAGLAIIGLLLALIVPPRRGRRIALAALLVPVAGLLFAGSALNQARAVPPIHDISTDLTDPPGFSPTVIAARAEVPAGNSLDFAGKTVPDNPRFGPAAGKPMIELHRAGYPDIAPVRLADVPPDVAFARVEAAARAAGWSVTRADPAAGVVEAEATSFWFGFVDDIAVRVRAAPEGGAVIDIRSVSRVGVSDLGANAARIRRFASEVRAG